ncbi:MAG: hypothetical protein V4579_01370 [Pseudomonadota bacterium]
MDGATQPKLGAQFAAALDWWRDAGVDLCFADEPTQWLPREPDVSATTSVSGPVPNDASRRSQVADIAQSADIGGGRDRWPRSLADFAPWWLSEPGLDHGAVQRRVAPCGAAGPELMIVVPHPEAGDDAGAEGPKLLSGPEGRLLEAMIAAMGIDIDQVYKAAVLPRHMPLPDWPAVHAAGFGDVLIHHVGLVAPKRLIVFGQNILPLIGHDLAQKTAVLQSLNHQGGTIPLLGAHELRGMLTRPRSKAAFWQRWLDWTGTTL